MARMKQISIDVDVDKAIYANRNTHSESENDILRRMLLSPTAPAPHKNPMRIAPPQESRHRGDWSVFLNGEEARTANMKGAYCALLRLLAEQDLQFLQRFSGLKSRTRRFVARDGASLFQSSPHLAKDHAAALTDGWFVDTNLSKTQVSARARAAAETAGLIYGSQVRITEAGQII